MKGEDVRLFDKREVVHIRERRLPHWIQPGTLCFVTWRECDSLPQSTLRTIEKEIAALEASHRSRRVASTDMGKQRVRMAQHASLVRKAFAVYEKYIDAGYGKCLLQDPRCAEVVSEALLRFDECRYFLTDFVIMPNHVHIIGAFPNQESFLRQAENWKRLTARRINQMLGTRGPLWKTDQFDHLIRSDDAFEYYRKYIADNPRNAGLEEGRCVHFSKNL